MPPEKSTTYECRRGLPQQGMRRVISLTINDLNRLSSSDLPCRQLRNDDKTGDLCKKSDLPCRQLRKGAVAPAWYDDCDLPCRQLRNVPLLFRQGIGCDLPCRQLRNFSPYS